MSSRLIVIVLITVLAGHAAAVQPKPLVLTYNHDRDVPLPFMVGGSDLAFMDFNGDGLKDILVCPNGNQLLLRRNIGTPTEPRFANVYEEEEIAINDPRIGRFFTLMQHSGLNRPMQMPAVICFQKHAGIKDIGGKDLPLNLFIPQRQHDKVTWQVIPALWPDGTPLAAFADSWMGPSLTVVDWDADGKDDLLVGDWRPSVAQPNGKYTAGYNHPQESWNPYAGQVCLMRNVSDGERLTFDKPRVVNADGKPIKTYGFVYPRTQDIDGDGLFDLVIGEQRPGLRWYRNVGSIDQPRFTAAGMLGDAAGDPIYSIMALRAYFEDLNSDGTPEMITTSYMAFTMGLLRFDRVGGGTDLSHGWNYVGMLPMKGSKDTPLSGQGICTVEITDWNGDGVRDLLIGAEPGTPMIVINEGSNQQPVWDIPQRLKFVDGKPLEYYGIEVGRGSVWGPIEFYLERTLPRLADWDGDGTEDIVTGSMAARLLWLRGQRIEGELRFEQPRAMTMHGKPFDVAHRVQPVVRDFNGDGKLDVVALDADNVVTLWLGSGSDELRDPQPFFGPDDKPLQLNPAKLSVTSGRRGLGMIDWDLDGTLDLVTYDAFGPTVWGGYVRLRRGDPQKPLHFLAPVDLFEKISHHNGGVTFVDWNEDGIMDILVGGDHTHLGFHDQPRGQFFVMDGRDLPIPPARR
ncbi:MAG: VCBS repeat-containing protein [Phycisphaeraceae bacterium]|nr:VCBS repeat-containing protein [Phycisphaeraceae bacterium]